jgi:hypothetical protein
VHTLFPLHLCIRKWLKRNDQPGSIQILKNQSNIRNYAVRSDDDPKNQKPISRNYAVKSDDDPKTKTNTLAYAVKSDDGRNQQTLKPGTITYFFWEASPQHI